MAEAQAVTRFYKSMANTYPTLSYEVVTVRRLHPPDDLVERNR